MKISLIFALVGLFYLSAFCQESVPEAVLKSFNSRFSKAEKVKWEIEKSNEWEAEFKSGKKEMSACFDNLGQWLSTETEIHKKELPAEVFKNLSLQLEGFKVEEAELVETPDSKGYEVLLEKKDTEVEVFITQSGEVKIEKVMVDDDDEEGDSDQEKND